MRLLLTYATGTRSVSVLGSRHTARYQADRYLAGAYRTEAVLAVDSYDATGAHVEHRVAGGEWTDRDGRAIGPLCPECGEESERPDDRCAACEAHDPPPVRCDQAHCYATAARGTRCEAHAGAMEPAPGAGGGAEGQLSPGGPGAASMASTDDDSNAEGDGR